MIYAAGTDNSDIFERFCQGMVVPANVALDKVPRNAILRFGTQDLHASDVIKALDNGYRVISFARFCPQNDSSFELDSWNEELQAL